MQNLPCCKQPYLFARKGDGSIWISNFVSFIEDHIVPVVSANVILHQSDVGIRGYQNSMTTHNISDQPLL